MKLSDVLASQVSGRARTRGHAYFAGGAVRNLTAHGGTIDATVQGSQPYVVQLDAVGERLLAECSCPYFFDHVEICKHIWAVLLAAEARALPLMPPGTSFDAVEFEPVDPDDVFDEDEDEFGDPVVDMDEGDEDGWWGPPSPPTARPSQRLTAAQRRAVAERMKKYWAERRKASGRASAIVPVAPDTRSTVAPAPAGPRVPETPSSRRAPATPPPWRSLLDSIVASSAPDAAVRTALVPGQLVYAIDAAASRAAGILVLELMTRDRKANGEWGKPKTARVTTADIQAMPACDDRRILEKLLGARPHLEWGGYADYGYQLSRIRLGGVLVAELVPLLCATGRCLARVEEDAAPAPGAFSKPRPVLLPLAWDDGAPWTFAMQIRRDDSTGGYLLDGSLARDGERMSVADPVLVLADEVLVTRSSAARLAHGGAFAWLAALRRSAPIPIPSEARLDLADALIARTPQLAEVPDDLRIDTIDGQPRPCLRLRRSRSSPSDRLLAEVSFDYEGTIVSSDASRPVIRAAGAARAIRRHVSAERQALEALQRLGCRHEWSYELRRRALQLPTHRVPKVVRQLVGDGWHVEAEGRTYRKPGACSIDVRSGIDWFELHGQVAYDDQAVALPALLAALERGESFVMLDDGTVGLLPEAWLRKHGLLARFGSPEGDHLRFKSSQAALLDALLAAQPEATWDETFARARERLRSFDGISALDPVASFAGTLRAYQRDGLGWLTFLQQFGFGGCLADDMGLGKTVMVLALLDARRVAQPPDDRRPSLVVVPRSLVFNWRQEALRFAPELRVLDYSGTGRATMGAQFGEVDLVLTTYGTLRRDAAHLADWRFDYVVLDEAQAIKNAQTASAKACRLLDARHRLALSGTPIENHLGELGSLFEFLNPGLLGRAAFARLTRAGTLDEAELSLLARGLRPFILRRTKAQVATELPPKTEQTIYCELERPQRAQYDQLRAYYRGALLERIGRTGLARAKLQILEALLRLRQAACHPGLIDKQRASDACAKLDVLVPRVREAVEEGHKTLVFSQFTSFLAILRARLDAEQVPYEYLDGRTRDREARVGRFQTDERCRLFLISLKAGGLGLNLTAAEYVFLLDPWWNPAVEAQAIDRTHRIGQTRHVFAYRLIARDTVEERVLELQQRKRRLADAILTADTSLLRDLRREDLELLLS